VFRETPGARRSDERERLYGLMQDHIGVANHYCISSVQWGAWCGSSRVVMYWYFRWDEIHLHAASWRPCPESFSLETSQQLFGDKRIADVSSKYPGSGTGYHCKLTCLQMVMAWESQNHLEIEGVIVKPRFVIQWLGREFPGFAAFFTVSTRRQS
jgi:hypothetical protein